MAKTDVSVTSHGSIFSVLPITKKAKRWIDNNVSVDCQWFGNSLCVEARYIENLVLGMQSDGLVVS